jgi:hypothetical protein
MTYKSSASGHVASSSSSPPQRSSDKEESTDGSLGDGYERASTKFVSRHSPQTDSKEVAATSSEKIRASA